MQEEVIGEHVNRHERTRGHRLNQTVLYEQSVGNSIILVSQFLQTERYLGVAMSRLHQPNEHDVHARWNLFNTQFSALGNSTLYFVGKS